MRGGRGLIVQAALVGAVAGSAAAAPPALALNPLKPLCQAADVASGVAGKLCSVAQHGGRLLAAGKKLFTGHVGGAVRALLGGGGSGVAATATTALALAALGTWVFGGARYAINQTAHVVSATTSPRLSSPWFSATYWRVAGIAALLTLPFLFAAATQALVASDLALLARSALGHLPLAMLGVAIAAPLTALLLSASDQLCAIVSAAAGDSGGRFLARASLALLALARVPGAPFVAFFIGLLIVAAALALWLELLARAAAVYVVVLLLPVVFAALVWPARRHWVTRVLELLVALILSKFVIVAVLSLGGAALGAGVGHGLAGLIAAVALLGLAVCAPWALLRLLPMTELAVGAVGAVHGGLHAAAAHGGGIGQRAAELADVLPDQADSEASAESPADEELGRAAVARMRRDRRVLAARGTVAAGQADGLAQTVADDSAPEASGGAWEAVPETSGDEGEVAPGAPGGEGEAVGEPHAGVQGTAADEPISAPPAPRGQQTGPAPRSPGMDAIWQLDDFAWRTLELGADRDWPPRVWPDGHEPDTEPEP